MDDDKRESRGGCAVAIGVGLVFLPVLYLLLLGPAVWLTVKGVLPVWLIEEIYAPLKILSQWWPAFSDAVDWYVELWSG